jgi:porphobilinogen synthase
MSELPVLPGFPVSRPRRLRLTPALRRMTADVAVTPSELILPMFVREGVTEPQPIRSMPGVVQHTLDSLTKAAHEAIEAGVGGLMLFGVPTRKDARGSGADAPDGILNLALRRLRSEFADSTVLMSDLCLDEFTLQRYAAMGVAQAEAGAHLVGTSGMMDGQVGAVRTALDRRGSADVGILAYSAKYSSGFYGPFREAVDSSLRGDRKTYQQDPARSVTEALAETALDVSEGADIVMVKPALPYLDVLRAVADASPVPVAAYQVSGEFAMVEAAAANGWLDRDRAMIETLTAIRRAGASMILTYWAVEAVAILR